MTVKHVDNTEPQPSRIWACEECPSIFADEELRRDVATGKWGHVCKAKKFRKEVRCESYCEPYLPESPK